MAIAVKTENTNINLTELDKRAALFYKPRGDRVLARPISIEEKSKGGVVLPETFRERQSLRAVVIAIGPGRRTEEGGRISIDDLAVGDVVAYPIMAGSPFPLDGVDYLLLREGECSMRVIQGDDAK